MSDNKKAIDILLAFGPKGKKVAKGDDEAAEGEGEDSMGIETAMEDLIAAIKAGDAKAAAAAFRAASDMC